MPTQRFNAWKPVTIGDVYFDASLRTAGEIMAQRWIVEADRLANELSVVTAAQALADEMCPADAIASNAATARQITQLRVAS